MSVRASEFTSKRDAVENAFARNSARPVEKFAQRFGVLLRERRILFQRQRDHGFDVFGSAARIGNKFSSSRRSFLRRHVFDTRSNDSLFLRFVKRTLLENLIVP